jgi:hypothetical protein
MGISMDNEQLQELRVTTGKLFYTVTLLSRVVNISPQVLENLIDDDWDDIEKKINVNLDIEGLSNLSEELYTSIFVKGLMSVLDKRLEHMTNSSLNHNHDNN